jgi:urease accessory protein
MKKQLVIGIACSLFSTMALAHPDHGLTSAYAGFTHPFMGLDHLLMMLAIGVWAAKLAGALRWQLPATFIGFMAIGAGLGFLGFKVLGIETAIAASVMAMGVLLVISLPMSPIVRFSIVAVFAIMHGLAHGLELGVTQNPEFQVSVTQSFQALLGILLATALLHWFGFYVGMQRHLVTKWLSSSLAFMMFLAGGFLLLN